MNDLEKLCPKFLQTPNAAGIIAFLFNEFMDLEMRMAVPDAVARQIGQYMQANGYGIVFNKFYKQREEQILESVTHAQPVQPAGAQGEAVAYMPYDVYGNSGKPISKKDYNSGDTGAWQFGEYWGGTDPLYTKAPAAAINEQLLNAAKNVLRNETEDGWFISTVDCHSLKTAIAAAEAAKKGGGCVKHIYQCKHCESTSLSWNTSIRSTVNAPDGKLRTHEMECVFYLGCDYCSATLQTVRADDVAISLQGLLRTAIAEAAKKGGV